MEYPMDKSIIESASQLYLPLMNFYLNYSNQTVINANDLNPDFVRHFVPEDKSSSGKTGDIPEEPEEPKTWDDIFELTGGLKPEDIEVLRNVHDLDVIYPLLHSLVGRSPRDFLVRAAVLEALVAAGRPAFSTDDFSEILYWLAAEPRDSILKALRSSGWLEFNPGQGTIITNAGHWAFVLLSFLHKRLEENEFLPTVAGVEYALTIGVDPVRHLQSMRSRLVTLQGEMEIARLSYSEVVLRRAKGKLDEVINLSKQARTVLDRVPLDNLPARRIVQDIHSLLSSLHTGSAELHGAITEVGRQHLKLAAGMTPEQIVHGLMRLSQDDLASACHEALFPSFPTVSLLTTEVVAQAAELHMLKERHEPAPVVWIEPPEPPKDIEKKGIPEEVLALISDLSLIASKKEPVPLADVVPRNNPGESFLRASLMMLAGNKHAGEGIVGRLGALTVDIEVEGDGWPEPIKGGPLKGLSRGSVKPREGA